MLRVVFLAFLVFGLVACGDNGTEPDSILGTYTSQTVNGEEFGYTFQSFNPDGTQSITEVTAEHIVLGPQSSCEVNITSTVSFFFGGFFVADTTMTETIRAGTFEFSNGAITLNYTDGVVDTGSIVGSTLTITRGDDVIVYRK